MSFLLMGLSLANLLLVAPAVVTFLFRVTLPPWIAPRWSLWRAVTLSWSPLSSPPILRTASSMRIWLRCDWQEPCC